MARELKPYDDEFADPEASYRRGFQHGAAALLRLVADKFKPSDAQQLAQWVGADLRDWRIVGHEVADALVPPVPSAMARSYPTVRASPGPEADT